MIEERVGWMSGEELLPGERAAERRAIRTGAYVKVIGILGELDDAERVQILRGCIAFFEVALKDLDLKK